MTTVDNRSQERNTVTIPAIITGQDDWDTKWEENTTIFNLSKNSAGLVLNRKCQIGRLLLLSAPIPLELRCEDQDDENYQIWGIIQHCTLVAENDSLEKYYLGIALIGETPPDSYLENPLQDYRLSGVKENGLWIITETGKEFKSRKYPRYSDSIEIYLGLLDEQSNLTVGEKVFTENISVGGAAVFTNLELKVGDCVKFISAEYEFSALAVVRNVHQYNDQKIKARLEFISGRFPVEKVISKVEAS